MERSTSSKNFVSLGSFVCSDNIGTRLRLEESASFPPMIGTLSNTNSTIGLLGNMIFSSVEMASEPEWPHRELPILTDFDVPATIFHVDCGLVDDLVKQNGIGTDREWNVTLGITQQDPESGLSLVGIPPGPIKWLGESS